MTTQIAIRLPDDMVAFLDEEVAGQHATSRAAVVLRALERERRRVIATRDIAILSRRAASDDDLQALAVYVADQALDLP